MARIELQRVGKVFTGADRASVTALAEVDLAVVEGEFLAVVGPSGCGKTTLLRIMAGLETPTSGTVQIDGKSAGQISPQDRDAAMVFQNGALFPHLTVSENLALPLKLRHTPRRSITESVATTARLLDLEALLDRLPEELSGGQRQRLALGRAIIRRPNLLLMDEPLSNLDAPTRMQLRQVIQELQRRLQVTTVYVTHDQAEALALGTRIAVMRAGRMQQVSGARTLYDAPENLFVAGFIGHPPMNFFQARVIKKADDLAIRLKPHAGTGEDSPADFSVPPPWLDPLRRYLDKPIVLGVRPENIQLEPKVENSPGHIILDAELRRTENLGPEWLYHLRANGCSFIARSFGTSEATPMGKLRVGLSLARAHVFDPATEQRLPLRI